MAEEVRFLLATIQIQSNLFVNILTRALLYYFNKQVSVDVANDYLDTGALLRFYCLCRLILPCNALSIAFKCGCNVW